MGMHVHYHFNFTGLDDPRITEILALSRAQSGTTKDVQNMAHTLDEVLAKVQEEDTKEDSLLALLNGIKQQLNDALSTTTLPPAVQAQVDAIFDQANASSDKISAALDANTPATPAP